MKGFIKHLVVVVFVLVAFRDRRFGINNVRVIDVGGQVMGEKLQGRRRENNRFIIIFSIDWEGRRIIGF